MNGKRGKLRTWNSKSRSVCSSNSMTQRDHVSTLVTLPAQAVQIQCIAVVEYLRSVSRKGSSYDWRIDRRRMVTGLGLASGRSNQVGYDKIIDQCKSRFNPLAQTRAKNLTNKWQKKKVGISRF